MSNILTGDSGSTDQRRAALYAALYAHQCPADDCLLGYGNFPGGDAILFAPDEDSCSPKELEAWASAVDADLFKLDGGCRIGPSAIVCTSGGLGMGTYLLPCSAEHRRIARDAALAVLAPRSP